MFNHKEKLSSTFSSRLKYWNTNQEGKENLIKKERRRKRKYKKGHETIFLYMGIIVFSYSCIYIFDFWSF